MQRERLGTHTDKGDITFLVSNNKRGHKILGK